MQNNNVEIQTSALVFKGFILITFYAAIDLWVFNEFGENCGIYQMDLWGFSFYLHIKGSANQLISSKACLSNANIGKYKHGIIQTGSLVKSFLYVL